jgi:DNA (cytosine-5)-methyltransferase 1
MESFGAECVFSSEIDKYCQETYYDNTGHLPAGDITKVKEENILKHDILCAGFPCQSFSQSGTQLGLNDPRGQLFFDIVRIAAYHKPKLLLLENVPTLLTHDNNKTFQTIIANLDSIGYDVFYEVLNSSDFGVPQHRKRLYIMVFHRSLDVKQLNVPRGTFLPVYLKDILLTDEETVDYRVHRDDVVYLDVDKERYGHRPLKIGTITKGGQGNRVYSEKGHAITLSANGGGVGRNTGLYLINGHLRKLHPRECARLMGFPDTFIINKKPAQALKQFGNSVVINVLQHILKNISEQVKI